MSTHPFLFLAKNEEMEKRKTTSRLKSPFPPLEVEGKAA